MCCCSAIKDPKWVAFPVPENVSNTSVEERNVKTEVPERRALNGTWPWSLAVRDPTLDAAATE